MSPELLAAIKERIELGRSKEAIIEELRNAGYDDASIESAYSSAASDTTTTAPASDIPPAKIIGYGELISDSFALMRSQAPAFFTAYGVGLAYWIVAAAVIGPFLLKEAWGAAVGIGILLFIGGVLLGHSLALGLLRVLVGRAQSFTLWSSAKWALARFFPFLLVTFAIQFVTQAGYIFLIIPGIALAMYLAFSAPVFVDSEHRGMQALIRSVELVHKRWWPVTARLFVVGLISFLIMIIVGGTLFVAAIMPWVASAPDISTLTDFARIDLVTPIALMLVFLILIFVLSAYTTCANVLMYESLRATTPLNRLSDKAKKNLRVLFWLLFVIGLLFGNLPTGTGDEELEKQIEQFFNQQFSDDIPYEGEFDIDLDLPADQIIDFER